MLALFGQHSFWVIRPYPLACPWCDLCLTEKVVILLGHDGPEKIPRSTILLNRRTELLQKCRHMRKFTYAGFKTRKWDYECPGNPAGTEEEIQWKLKCEGRLLLHNGRRFFSGRIILCEMALQNQFYYCLKIRKLKLRVTIKNLNQFFFKNLYLHFLTFSIYLFRLS